MLKTVEQLAQQVRTEIPYKNFLLAKQSRWFYADLSFMCVPDKLKSKFEEFFQNKKHGSWKKRSEALCN